MGNQAQRGAAPHLSNSLSPNSSVLTNSTYESSSSPRTISRTTTFSATRSLSRLHPSLKSEQFLETMKSLYDYSADFDFVATDCIVKDIALKFKFIRQLGKGLSCEVHLAESLRSKKQVALKCMTLSDEDNSLRFKNEVEILDSLRHPNIVKFYRAYVDENNLYIATKFCRGGHLLNRIRRLKIFSEQKAAKHLRALIDTIKYCHDRNIVHRDLKPLNVMFSDESENAHIVVIDFGDALKVEDHNLYSEIFGTVLFLPPEFNRKRLGRELKKGDMWSIGVIAFVLLTGTCPYMGTQKQVLYQIKRHTKVKWPSKPKISDVCKDFINGLLEKDTMKRFSAAEALEHPFLANIQKQSTIHLGDNLLNDIGNLYQANVLKKILTDALVRDMTDEQKRMFMKAFKEIDVKRNGYVTREEVTAWLRKTGLNEPNAEIRAEEIMNSMDPDRRGKITLSDFIRGKMVGSLQHQTSGLRRILGDACDGKEVDVDALATKFADTHSSEDVNEAMRALSVAHVDSFGKMDIQHFVDVVNIPNTHIQEKISVEQFSDEAFTYDDEDIKDILDSNEKAEKEEKEDKDGSSRRRLSDILSNMQVANLVRLESELDDRHLDRIMDVLHEEETIDERKERSSPKTAKKAFPKEAENRGRDDTGGSLAGFTVVDYN